jgi:excinuclease ABC subunit C
LALRFFFSSSAAPAPVLATPSTPETLRALRDHVRAGAKNAPGTYRMLAEGGEVLYVGKSKRVRTRLLSYFRAKEGEKGVRILREAKALDWRYEPSEFAALLGELEQIKRYRPRFNVQHKRDGRYTFLKLVAGAAPKLYVVNGVSDDAAAYFGPFRGGRRIQEAVRELNDVLGLRDCLLGMAIHYADQAELFAREQTPKCHRHSVGRCLGPCAALCTQAEYLAQVALARAFLEGHADEPIDRLTTRMDEAAESWNFEYAAMLRDRAQRLEMLRAEFGRLREALDRLSFLYPVAGEEGDDRVYLIRRGTVRECVPAPRTSRERKRLASRVFDHFGRPEPDSALVAKHQVDEILLLSRWFRSHPDELERAVPPEGLDRLRLAG